MPASYGATLVRRRPARRGSDGWDVDRRPPGEAVLGPVPPPDRVLAVEPAQVVGAAGRRGRGEVDEAALGVAHNDAGVVELAEDGVELLGGIAPVRRALVPVAADVGRLVAGAGDDRAHALYELTDPGQARG